MLLASLKRTLNSVEFNAPTTAVVQNFDARSHSDLDEIKQTVVKQLYKPVLWTQSVQELVHLGVRGNYRMRPK